MRLHFKAYAFIFFNSPIKIRNTSSRKQIQHSNELNANTFNKEHTCSTAAHRWRKPESSEVLFGS